MWCAVYSVQCVVSGVHVQIQGHFQVQVLCVMYTVLFAGGRVLPKKEENLAIESG